MTWIFQKVFWKSPSIPKRFITWNLEDVLLHRSEDVHKNLTSGGFPKISSNGSASFSEAIPEYSSQIMKSTTLKPQENIPLWMELANQSVWNSCELFWYSMNILYKSQKNVWLKSQSIPDGVFSEIHRSEISLGHILSWWKSLWSVQNVLTSGLGSRSGSSLGALDQQLIL